MGCDARLLINALALQCFFLMGQPRPLFVYFRSFQTQILQKKLLASADLNSNRRGRGAAR